MLQHLGARLLIPALVLALSAASADARPSRGGGGGRGGGGRGGGGQAYHGGGGYRGGYSGARSYGGYSGARSYGGYSGARGYGGYGGYRGYGYGGYRGYGYGGFYPGYGYGVGLGLGGYSSYYQPYYGGYSYGSYPYATYTTPAPVYFSSPAGTIIPSDTTNLASGSSVIRTTSGYTPDEATQDNLAHIRVRVPANAQVWVEGEKTTQRGTVREFTSPPLQPGQSYVYTIRASWPRAGGPVDQSREVHVRANGMSEVDFTSSASR